MKFRGKILHFSKMHGVDLYCSLEVDTTAGTGCKRNYRPGNGTVEANMDEEYAGTVTLRPLSPESESG